MHSRLIALVLMTLVAAVASARDKPAPDKEKLIGVWEFSQKEGMTKVTYTTEFLKEGNFKGSMKAAGESRTFTGTYKLDGDMLTMFNAPGTEGPFLAKGSVARIKTLTDKMLVLEQKVGDTTKTLVFTKK
jgi:uncharacterized protein (TIGR03066 family)